MCWLRERLHCAVWAKGRQACLLQGMPSKAQEVLRMKCAECKSTNIKTRRNYTHGKKSKPRITHICAKCGSVNMEVENTRRRRRWKERQSSSAAQRENPLARFIYPGFFLQGKGDSYETYSNIGNSSCIPFWMLDAEPAVTSYGIVNKGFNS